MFVIRDQIYNKFAACTIALIFLLGSCQNDRPNIPQGVIQPEKMISILTDLHLVEGNAQVARRFTAAGMDFYDSSYQLIYAMHEVNMQTFDSSFNFYIKHPKYFEKMYEEVIDNINHFEEPK